MVFFNIRKLSNYYEWLIMNGLIDFVTFTLISGCLLLRALIQIRIPRSVVKVIAVYAVTNPVTIISVYYFALY